MYNTQAITRSMPAAESLVDSAKLSQMHVKVTRKQRAEQIKQEINFDPTVANQTVLTAKLLEANMSAESDMLKGAQLLMDQPFFGALALRPSLFKTMTTVIPQPRTACVLSTTVSSSAS